MLEMRAIVVSVQGQQAEITPLHGGGCGHCDSANGCGSGKVSQLFCSGQSRKFVVKNQAGARVGDEVEVTLPEGTLLRSSWRMYGLPLLLLLCGGLAGSFFASETAASGDGFALLGAILGLLSAFAWEKYFAASDAPQAVVRSVVSTHIQS